MKTAAVILFLPVLIYAKIDIDITASDDPAQRRLQISGSNENIISALERLTFKLTEENLKHAVKSHFGVVPDDVFVKSPTPWGDLYRTNSWKQVTTAIKPLKAKILSLKHESYVILKEFFNNTNFLPASFKTEIKQDVKNTVASVWLRYGGLSNRQMIDYTFHIKTRAVGEMYFSYTSKWGQNVAKTQKVTVGSKTGVVFALEPHQAVTVDLYATKGSMRIQVDYAASLTGSVAVNYENYYKDHHFWAIDVNRVMEAGGLNKTVPLSEVIDFGFYGDARVDIRDVDTKIVLSSIPMTVF